MFLFQSNPIYLVPSYVKKFLSSFCVFVCMSWDGGMASERGGGVMIVTSLILEKLVHWPKQVRPLNTGFSKQVICL